MSDDHLASTDGRMMPVLGLGSRLLTAGSAAASDHTIYDFFSHDFLRSRPQARRRKRVHGAAHGINWHTVVPDCAASHSGVWTDIVVSDRDHETMSMS
jgi:hypothetical protein